MWAAAFLRSWRLTTLRTLLPNPRPFGGTDITDFYDAVARKSPVDAGRAATLLIGCARAGKTGPIKLLAPYVADVAAFKHSRFLPHSLLLQHDEPDVGVR